MDATPLQTASQLERMSAWQRFELWKIERSLVGWKFSLRLGALLATLVYAFNTAALIWALGYAQDIGDGRAILFEGKCSQVQHYNTIFHIYINIASTLLTATSNFSMQGLSSPTRHEVRRAHRKKVWLDIGVTSLGNLPHVSIRKALSWTILAGTCLSLHLLFNATILSTIDTGSYTIYTVNPGVFRVTENGVLVDQSIVSSNVQEVQKIVYKQDFPQVNETTYLRSTVQHYTKSQCIHMFARPFISDRHFVFLELSKHKNLTRVFNISQRIDAMELLDPDKPQGCHIDPYGWICAKDTSGNCPDPCTMSSTKGNIDWTPFQSDQKVSGCYSTQMEEHCRLEMASQLVIAVVAITFVKALTGNITAYYTEAAPLLTVGDAVSSFIAQKDRHTRNTQFLQLRDANYKAAWSSRPRLWYPSRQRRIHAISCNRRNAFLGLYITILSLASVGLVLATLNTKGKKTFTTFRQLGFGSVDFRTIITRNFIDKNSPSVIWGNTVTANMAQPLLSILYFSYNGILTAITLATEWDAFGKTRKGLRVSGIPQGKQRGTHFLQLPYRYAIPHAAISSLLHWLPSQSLFPISITIDQGDSVITCGFSPLAILCFLITILSLFGYLSFMAIRRFSCGTPIVGSCSAAISATCHIPDFSDRSTIPTLPLKWGAIQRHGSDELDTRCTFWHLDVHFPEYSIRLDLWVDLTRQRLLEQGWLHDLCRYDLPSRRVQRIQKTYVLFQPERAMSLWKDDQEVLNDIRLARAIWPGVAFSGWKTSEKMFWGIIYGSRDEKV